MPKKRSARHHSAAQLQRPQSKKDVVLVRAGSASGAVETIEEAEEQTTTEATKTVEAKTKPANVSTKAAERSIAAAGRHQGATGKSGTQSTRVLPAAQRTGQPGQRSSGRPGQRLTVGRQANLVSAEHYRYVLKDLRLIGILAAIMFSIIIALTFILPHLLKY